MSFYFLSLHHSRIFFSRYFLLFSFLLSFFFTPSYVNTKPVTVRGSLLSLLLFLSLSLSIITVTTRHTCIPLLSFSPNPFSASMTRRVVPFHFSLLTEHFRVPLTSETKSWLVSYFNSNKDVFPFGVKAVK